MTKKELELENALLEAKVQELTTELNTTTSAFNKINDSIGEIDYNYEPDYLEYKEKYEKVLESRDVYLEKYEEIKKVNKYLEKLIYLLEINNNQDYD